ncbi:Bug family tripartite tricarboxylate transporter substrate binding protein [Billgrantia endophytica]|uniref:Tripartite tricarboxylate transporter substrate binding protein n=1 Tax=Billgrantia endophytica TaxID=2033802 RepID=A0A2N7U7R8_9GAMM|nr:tripartite tricarboxylate transporter substrate binding protein [Halomonas endophytica]PMR76477.1 hypothetical protein C1H69_05385 [Halomonas endophytica]
MKFKHWIVASTMSLVVGGLTASAAHAQHYPQRPVTIVVPFAPGGSTDALARIVAEGLSNELGQRVVVANRPGAGGNIGMTAVANARPDGYTLVLVSSSLVINPSLYGSVSYDPVESFAPISYVASAPSIWVANAGIGVESAQEMLERMASGEMPYYGSPGIGTAQHLAGELLAHYADISLEHVPYNGAGPAVAGMVAGDVPSGFSSLPGVQSQIDDGLLTPLAITTLQRSEQLPEVPTFDEIGLEGYEVDHLQGLLAPSDTPEEIVGIIHDALVEFMNSAETSSRIAGLGFVPVVSTPREFAEQIAEQVEKWSEIIGAAGISVQ